MFEQAQVQVLAKAQALEPEQALGLASAQVQVLASALALVPERG